MRRRSSAGIALADLEFHKTIITGSQISIPAITSVALNIVFDADRVQQRNAGFAGAVFQHEPMRRLKTDELLSTLAKHPR